MADDNITTLRPGVATLMPLGAPRHDLGQLVADIKATVYQCSNVLSVTEIVGALEIAKLEILQEQR